MQLMEWIRSRRTIRNFTEQPLAKTDLQEILECWMHAPSAHNQQPREFLVLQDKDQLLRLGQHLKFGKMLPQADTAIISCFNKKIITDPAFIQQDMSACSQNILLAAHEKGIGAVWIGIYPLNNPGHYLNTYFQLPDYIDIFNVIALGYPDPAIKPLNKECVKGEKIHRDAR